jgi:hypothetical protein
VCDYSLHAVASRPAKVGETLVSTRFSTGGTVGFASPTNLGVAVCLQPGTELAFETNVRYRAASGDEGLFNDAGVTSWPIADRPPTHTAIWTKTRRLNLAGFLCANRHATD